MKLSVSCAPHRVTVVDTDMLSLLDVDSSSDDNSVVTVEMFTGIVDARVLKD